MSIEILSITITILLAIIGYLATYWNSLLIARRNDQLELINKRLGDFYGPLYIATQSSNRAYKAFLSKLRRNPESRLVDRHRAPTEAELLEWRLWVENVFMPINEHIEDLILNNAYLIQEKEMPECLLQFIVHVSAYKAITEKWRNGDFRDIDSIIDFPKELEVYATDSYKQLKARQIELLGKMKVTDRRN